MLNLYKCYAKLILYKLYMGDIYIIKKYYFIFFISYTFLMSFLIFCEITEFNLLILLKNYNI
jgi:hypothetical protein